MQAHLRSIADHSQISHHESNSEFEEGTNRRRKYPEGERGFKIPLISKKLNSIEKYISEFDDRQPDLRCEDKGQIFGTSKYLDGSMERELISHYRSVDVYSLGEGDGRSLNGQSCVKYASIANESSQERLEKLAKLQKDYGLLKQKLHPHKKIASGDFSARKSRSIEKKNLQDISQEDIEREIKNTVVNDNGKKYFADLYLLKKGRQNIMSSLSTVGKLALGSTGSDSMTLSQLFGRQTYEEKVKASQKDFVSSKIMQDRETKRSKMMKGRNLHWNVYYDMLALSASERQKLKGLCKFSSTFGIS